MLLAVLAGVVIGLVLGALGGGGSILAVPALAHLFNEETQQAMAGALVVVAVSSVTAVLTHTRHGRVHWRAGTLFGVLGIVGSWFGSRMSGLVDGDLLLVWFAGLLLVVAALMVRRSKRPPGTGEPTSAQDAASPTTQDPTPPTAPDPTRSESPDRRSLPAVHPARLVATATGVGLLTGFFGVGGGFAAVPALVLALDLPMATAVGTSLLVITINSVAALGSRLADGIHPDWAVVVPFTVAAALASFIGARAAHRLSPRLLSRVFAGLLVAVAVWIGAQGIGSLS